MYLRSTLTLLFSLLALLNANSAFDEESGIDPYAGGSDPYGGGYSDPYGGNDYGGEGGGYGGAALSVARELQSVDDIDSFFKDDAEFPKVIGYFDEVSHKADLDSFKELSGIDGSKYKFAYTISKEVLEEKKYDGCAVVVHPAAKFVSEKHNERSKFRYPSKTITKVEHLRDFVRQKALPVVGLVTPATTGLYSTVGLPVVTVFTAVDLARNPKGFSYITNRVRKVAAAFKGKVLFSVGNTADFAELLEKDYGFEDAQGRDVLVGLVDGNMYYAMDAAGSEAKFSVDSLRAFVEAFTAGSLVGKEKLPEKQSRGGDEDDDSESHVVTLTGDNFKEAVTESAADVLVEFYAPWCGHCKQLKPEFKRAAAAFADDSGVTLAAMDATAHTVPKEFNVEGYPTLYFVPATGPKAKMHIAYEGGRDEASIVQWLHEHRTTTPV